LQEDGIIRGAQKKYPKDSMLNKVVMMQVKLEARVQLNNSLQEEKSINVSNRFG
jgi:hypothetical protein